MPAPTPTPTSGGGRAARDLTRLGTLLGKVVAPTTALTALLFYFGWSHAYWFFDYLGVNSTILGLSTTDYLMRSLDGLFVPMIAAAVTALLLLWAHEFGRTHLPAVVRTRLHQIGIWILPIVGLVLVLNALSPWFWWNRLNNTPAVVPLSLAAGVLLLVWTAHRRRSEARSEVTHRHTSGRWLLAQLSVFLLVGLMLFWAVHDYSAAVGTARARELIDSLHAQPHLILYSERSLSLDAPGVRRVRCVDPEAAYRFRYDGLKLVIHSGDQYVVLPAQWSARNGVAIVLPRMDSIRLEFARASTAEQGSSC